MVEKIGINTGKVKRLDPEEFDALPPSQKRYMGDGSHVGGCALYASNPEICKAKVRAWRAQQRGDPLFIRLIEGVVRLFGRIFKRSRDDYPVPKELPKPHVIQDEFTGDDFFNQHRIPHHLRNTDAGIHYIAEALKALRAEYQPGCIYDERALDTSVVVHLARAFENARIGWRGWRPRYVVDVDDGHLDHLSAISTALVSAIEPLGRRVQVTTYTRTVARTYIAGCVPKPTAPTANFPRGVFR